MDEPRQPMTPAPEPENPSDLVRRALAEHEGLLIGYAASLLGDIETARDVVQDTFIKLFEQEPGKIAIGSLKAWLVTVCRNKSLDVLRRRKRIVTMEEETLREPPSSAPNPMEAAERVEDSAEIFNHIKKLPENQRECLRMKFQLDLSYKEIAQATGLTVSNVGFLIHTGIKRLRQMLGGAPEEERPTQREHISEPPSRSLTKQITCPAH